jgi:hypothetical protein
MSTKINHHVFHGVYSNKYNPYSTTTTNRFFADYPIHIPRAIFGAPENEDSTKPIEFKNEKEAFTWYKKNKYGEDFFEKIPESEICKNYFTISADEFSKNRNFFHGMIKSFLFKWNCSFNIEGSVEYLNDCECPPEDGNYDPADYENCCFCPTCGDENEQAPVCQTNFDSTTSFDINIDTNKIFQIEELEGRIGATQLFRNFTLFTNDEEKEEGLSDLSGGIIFEKDWELSKTFKETFQPTNQFPDNATRINDPIIPRIGTFLQQSTYKYYNYDAGAFSYDFFSLKADVRTRGDFENQKYDLKIQDKKSNLEDITINVNSKNFNPGDLFLTFDFAITTIIYIRSEKKFLCFIELISRLSGGGLNSTISFAGEDPPQTIAMSAFSSLGRSFNPLCCFSTSDPLSIDNDTNANNCDFEFKKVKLNIKINNQNRQIEVLTPTKNTITLTQTKESLSVSDCESINLQSNCTSAQINFTQNIPNPVIEIRSWNDKEDFAEVVFPPKI